jgi:hypothetical protein
MNRASPHRPTPSDALVGALSDTLTFLDRSRAWRRLVSACLAAGAASMVGVASVANAGTQAQVFRCPADPSQRSSQSVTFSDQPCPGGRRVQGLAAATPTAQARQQARDLAQRESQWAEQLRRQRLEREAIDARLQAQRAREGVAGVRMAADPFASDATTQPRKQNHAQTGHETRWVPVRTVRLKAAAITTP